MNSSFLACAKKLLLSRPHGPILKSPVVESVALYDVRRSRHTNSHGLLRPTSQRPLLELALRIGPDPAPGSVRRAATHSPLPRYSPAAYGPMAHLGSPLLPIGQRDLPTRCAGTLPGKKQFEIPDPAQMAHDMISMLKCVDLQHLKDAPPPSFWVALATGGFQLAVPLLELFGGYSPLLTMAQLYVAAITLGFSGGQRWGLGVSEQKVPDRSWDTMASAGAPPVSAVLGLLLPVPLGFLAVGLGTVASLYLDLKLCAFPPWALAAALFVAASTLVGLLLGLSAYVLFHGSAQKKKEKKEAPPRTKKEEEDDEGDGAQAAGDKEK